MIVVQGAVPADFAMDFIRDDKRGIPVFASPAGLRSMSRLTFAILVFVLLTLQARADIGAYILIDAKNGAVIEQKNATRKWYPASLTKLMTAYITFKAIREGKVSLDSAVVQSKNSISEPPSKMGFKVGTPLYDRHRTENHHHQVSQ